MGEHVCFKVWFRFGLKVAPGTAVHGNFVWTHMDQDMSVEIFLMFGFKSAELAFMHSDLVRILMD